MNRVCTRPQSNQRICRVIATLLAAAVLVDLSQLGAAYIEAPSSCALLGLLQHVKAIDLDRILVAVGDALSPLSEEQFNHRIHRTI